MPPFYQQAVDKVQEERPESGCLSNELQADRASTAAPPYHAATNLTSSEIYLSTFPVTRAEYQEHGSAICRRRFGGPGYSINPPGFKSGEVAVDADGEVDEDARELRYAMGLESIRGKPLNASKGKNKKKEEEEVVSGNWGGRRRRAQGML